MRALLATISTGLLVLAAVSAPALADLSGRGRAVDGDTIALGGHTLRLFGVDAPETAQTCGAADGGDWACGAAARARLAALIDGRTIACAAQDRDTYGRVVAICAAGGVDLGATLVSEGLAWAYVRFTEAYAGLEAEARSARRGLWQGAATAAWDWRRSEGFAAAAGETPSAPAAAARSDAAPAAPATGGAPDAGAPAGCPIKGNVNVRGERIYHTPASPWYARVRIDPTRGQRWFCTEAEAEAAGWRPIR